MDLSVRKTLVGQGDQSWLASRDGTDVAMTVTIARASLTKNTHYPDGYLKSGTPLALATSGTYSGLYVPLAARTDEIQTVTITGTPTGGTFTLTLDGETTAAVAYNAAASAVQTALEGLSNLQPGDVTVTGGPGPGTPYVVTFGGAGRRAGSDVPQMTATGSFTGGTSPAVAVTTGTAGGAGVTDGSEALAGFLFTAQSVPADSTGDITAPMIWRGRILTAKLPLPVSSAAQKAAPLFRFE